MNGGRLFRGVLCCLLAGATACDSQDGDPLARTATLSPALDQGAVVVRFVGAPIASVSSDQGEVFFSTRRDTTRVVLLLTEPGPPRLDLRLEDPTLEPVGRVLQVADGDNALRADVSAYRVEVNP